MSETVLSRSIRETLNQLGYWIVRIPAGSYNSHRVHVAEPGFPDLVVVAPVAGYLEVKDPGEDLNDNQQKWHAKAARAGIRVAVVRSVKEAIEVVSMWRADRRSA